MTYVGKDPFVCIIELLPFWAGFCKHLVLHQHGNAVHMLPHVHLFHMYLSNFQVDCIVHNRKSTYSTQAGQPACLSGLQLCPAVLALMTATALNWMADKTCMLLMLPQEHHDVLTLQVHQLRQQEQGGQQSKPKRPRAVVLGPTRELTDQILQVAKSLCHHARFRSACVNGGAHIQQPLHK